MAIREASPRIKTIKTVWKTTSFVPLSSVTLFGSKKFDPDRGPPLLLSTHEDREKRLGSRGSAWLRQWGSAALCLPRVSLFFSLCSFRLYLGSVWFASTRRCSGPNSLSLSLFTSLPPLLSTTPPVIGLSIARAPSLHLCPSSTGPPVPSPPRRAPRLSATRVYIGPARWGFRQNDEQVKPTRPPLPPANPSRTRARAHARNRDIGSVRRKRTERAEGRRAWRVEGSPLDLLSHTGKEEARKEGPSTSRRTRTGGFVKTKARSFVESRSRGEEKERRGRGNVAGNVRGG